MKNYDAYLFDWDGTLARTLELWLEQIHRQFGAYGLKITLAENAREFGNLKSPLKFGLPPHQLTEFQEGINANMQTLLPHVPLYDDAAEMLAALKAQNKRLALVSTTRREFLDAVIGRHGVEDHFDLILTSEDVKTHKPDPEGINLAVERLSADKSRTIMLGDSDKDLLAARNAGIDSALFYPDAHNLIYGLEELLAHDPRHTIRTWQELIDQLQ
jgi:pyrophosphatase PpaX